MKAAKRKPTVTPFVKNLAEAIETLRNLNMWAYDIKQVDEAQLVNETWYEMSDDATYDLKITKNVKKARRVMLLDKIDDFSRVRHDLRIIWDKLNECSKLLGYDYAIDLMESVDTLFESKTEITPGET